MVKILKLDWVLFLAIALLLSISLISLFSISTTDGNLNSSFIYKQSISVAIGLVLFFILSFHDYRLLNLHSTKLFLFAIIILILSLIFGTKIRGTYGWIGFGIFNFQSVELVKIIMIIFLASFFSKKRNEFSNLIKVAVSIVMVAIPLFLILKQPDFGSAAVIAGIWLGMLLISGLDKKSFSILFLIIFLVSFSGYFMLKNYQKERIYNFVDPYRDPKGSGYNVIQSIVAVGSGGVWGKGLGHGSQSQLNFLPEKHTDFIFAVISEELGFIGGSVVLSLLLIIIYRLKKIAEKARDNFGYLLVVGIMLMLLIQIVVNIGMNIGLAPVTGVPLPFLSYGGSSMVVILMSMGLAQNVYLKRGKAID